MRKRPDNRGSSLILVIIIIAFVSILVASLFTMSVINIQMKSVDRTAKDNFYSAEGALEQITLGLQKELSDASTGAYALVMQQYANNTLEVQRRQIFNEKLLGTLKTRLNNGGATDVYSLDLLKTYLSTEVSAHTVLSSTKFCQLATESDSLVLKGLVVTYTDEQGYQSIIETDIRLSAPNLNLIQASDMPNVFDYSIIANEKLVALNSGTVNITAGVYAGEDGLTLDNGTVWNFKKANRVVVKGDMTIPNTATLTTTNDMDLWAREVNVSGGSLASRGRTYVANDLTLSGQGSNVTLEGEYYGYGNGEQLTDAGVTLSAGGDSSAILINGTDSTLDMSNMRRLLLSGSAQIATGFLEFDQSEIESILPENEPSLGDSKKVASISSGSYYFISVGNELMVCSTENHLVARTEADYTVVDGSWERLLIYYNEDNKTYSIYDPNHGKYVSLLSDNRLAATADSIGVAEKFYIYVITEGNTNYYAIQSYANGKFVSIDTYYPAEGDPVSGVLYANRDKITDNAQLFTMKHYGSLPMVSETTYEPVVTFAYQDSDSAVIKFGHTQWGTEVPAGYGAWLTYTVTRNGEVITTFAETHMQILIADNTRWSLYQEIPNLQENDVISYTIRYTDNTQAGNLNSVSGTYTHTSGQGNVVSDKVEFADGFYEWRLDLEDGTQKYLQADAAWQTANAILGYTTSYTKSNNAWQLFHLVNNHDGSISFKAYNGMYVCAQDDGLLVANSEEITDNCKFKVEYVGSTTDGYYRLYLQKDDTASKRYVYVTQGNYDPVYVSENPTSGRDRFQLEWLRCTTQVGTREEPVIPEEPVNYNPVTSMAYLDEESAQATFSSAYWSNGSVGTATLKYRISMTSGEAEREYPEIAMTVSGTSASCVVPGLRDNDKVFYYFTYTESDGTSKTTPEYIYIHETKYGDAIDINGGNVDIDLGESIEVKSNQIAYLVPAECIGVDEGKTLIGKNPMTATEFTKLMSYANNTTKYPNFEIVSFTKEVEGLGTNLGTYKTTGDGYQTIFVQSTGTDAETMVYFYVDFDSENTSKYFADYYEKNQSELEQYMSNYVNEIKLSGRFTRLTTNGNMVYSTSGATGKIDLKTNEGYGANLSESELSGLRNEETGYQKRFKALTSKLMLDYDEVTQTEKVRCLFDNIIRYSEEAGDTDGHSFAESNIPDNNVGISYYTEDGTTALVVDNKNADAYHYNGDSSQKICLIIATGDVVVEQDFSGVIIARGTVTVNDSAVHNITGNQEALYKVLKVKVDPTDPDSDTVIERFFRDGNKYDLDNSGTGIVTDGDYISYADLVTYEEWTKR